MDGAYMLGEHEIMVVPEGPYPLPSPTEVGLRLWILESAR